MIPKKLQALYREWYDLTNKIDALEELIVEINEEYEAPTCIEHRWDIVADMMTDTPDLQETPKKARKTVHSIPARSLPTYSKPPTIAQRLGLKERRDNEGNVYVEDTIEGGDPTSLSYEEMGKGEEI